MNSIDHEELLQTAKEHFENGELSLAEPLINQLILQGKKNAELFHMLGTIFYDQGKFNKAIRSFRRALELEPSYTDASIGLSIILNDLGRYDEGKKVFEEAQIMLAQQKATDDPYVNEKLSLKHDELGELYCQYKRYKEGMEQYYKALNLTSRVPEMKMKIVDCHVQLNDSDKAIEILKDLIKEYPGFLTARNKLGRIYYEQGQLPEAIDVWENVLRRNENNSEAQRFLRQAQNIEYIPPQETTL